jgi:hypothetical protein
MGYPLISRPVYRWWQLQQNALIAVRKQIEDEQPLTREQEKEIRKAVRDRDIKHTQELAQRDSRNDELELKLDALQAANLDDDTADEGQNSDLDTDTLTDRMRYEEIFRSLTTDQQELLREFYDVGGRISGRNLTEQRSVDVKHAAEVLTEKGIVIMSPVSWVLTPRGNALAVLASQNGWTL